MVIQVKMFAKWRLKSKPHYVWTTCKKLVNMRTGRLIKKTLMGNGRRAGYWIGREFVTIESLKEGMALELIVNEKLPF